VIGEAPPPEASNPVPAPAQAGSLTPEERPFSVSVVVLNAEGERVPDALVEVWDEAVSLTRRSSSVLESRTTDPSGRCTLTATSRRNALFASKSGVGTSGDWLLGGLAEERNEVVMVLHPQSKVRGLVLRADGTPARGAMVSFWLSATNRRGNPRPPPDQVTDAEGRFEVELESADIFYGLEAKDEEKRSGEWSVLARPGETKEVTLRFPGALAITGVLLDPDGRPVAGGWVGGWERRRVGEYAHPVMPHGKTEPDGSFRLETPRLGEYTVAGLADGFAETEPATARLTEGSPTASVSLSLFPASFIHGRVRRKTGEPVAGVFVRAWPHRLEGDRATFRVFFPGWFKTDHPSGRTAADGTFRLEPADPRLEYTVSSLPDGNPWGGRIRRRGVVPGGSPLEIVVTEEERRGAALAGIVESETTGRPLERFELTLSHQEAGEASWISYGQPGPIEDPDGRFRIEGLVVGDRYRIEVQADGHARVLVEPWTMEPTGKELRVRLPGPARLEVHVLDAARRPVSFAEVSLRRRSEVPVPRFWDPLRADEAGIASVEGIDPGRYEFRATKGAAKSVPVEAEVRGGSTTVVEVILPG
jgi:hypothetical protein